MDDIIELVERVLDKTAGIVDAVDPSQYHRPTPCPDYDVAALVSHIAGWIQAFAASANGDPYDGDPDTYVAGSETSAHVRAAATRIVEGWRRHGVDRNVAMMGGDMPGQMVLNMTIMEYVAHGWDLATATGQPIPYTEDEAEAALELAQGTLPAQFRGKGKPFGEVIDVPTTATALERFIAFLGRDPGAERKA